jgi:hypothetical protein
MECLRRFAAAAAFLASLSAVTAAEAYCQKSTCDPEKEECEKDDRGCVTSGAGVTWKEYPAIPFAFTATVPRGVSSSAARAAFRRAVKRWENVKCDGRVNTLVFEEQEELDTKPPSGKNAPTDFGIYFRNDSWPGDAAALAITRVEKKLTSGKITGASIQFNASGHDFTTDGEGGKFDLEAVMVHEIGHYIGLDHSRAEGAVMNPDYCNNEKPCSRSPEELRQLGDDDIAGLCDLYRPSNVADATIPTNNCQTGAVGTPGSTTSLLTILAGALVLGRRLRRR